MKQNSELVSEALASLEMAHYQYRALSMLKGFKYNTIYNDFPMLNNMHGYTTDMIAFRKNLSKNTIDISKIIKKFQDERGGTGHHISFDEARDIYKIFRNKSVTDKRPVGIHIDVPVTEDFYKGFAYQHWLEEGKTVNPKGIDACPHFAFSKEKQEYINPINYYIKIVNAYDKVHDKDPDIKAVAAKYEISVENFARRDAIAQRAILYYPTALEYGTPAHMDGIIKREKQSSECINYELHIDRKSVV